MTWEEKCDELWGERWKSVLASMILVDRRSVQKWANPNHPHKIPDDIKYRIEETYKLWIGE